MAVKISYQSTNNPDTGTHYNQCVSLSYSEFLHLKSAIESETILGYPRAKEYDNGNLHNPRLHLNPLRKRAGVNKVYLTLTQARFIKLFLLKKDKKRFLDRNTMLFIKNN